MSISPKQIKAARLLIGWSRTDVAANSAVGFDTISRIETGERGQYDRAILNLQAVFESAGVEFIAENGGGAGVRLRKGGQ